ncbi:MAG: hypothetical protein LH467_06420 [Gemmatimonadaceae bacterium]|nr:hypothetical protein [Gemmatimonadaceae bacterium]
MPARIPPPSGDAAAFASLERRLGRRADATVLFELRRRDGTSTWEKRSHPTAEFFSAHDLTHFAVESELGFRDAFYGLVARGCQLRDFGRPWPRGPPPPEALLAEVLVGYIDVTRASGHPLTADDCNRSVRDYFAATSHTVDLVITDAALQRIRTRLHGLLHL